jgi:hypothetical protein
MTNRIEDERVIFYLRHQDLIDTWSAVRKDVIESANAFYMTLAEDLAGVASDQGDDVEVWVNGGTNSRVGLYRRGWLVDGSAPIITCLEWHHQSTFDDGARHVGVFLRNWEPGLQGLREQVEETLRGQREVRGFPKSNQVWPAYRPAPSPVGDAYWENLSDYRTLLLTEIVSAWEAFAEHVEQAVLVWRSSNPPK